VPENSESQDLVTVPEKRPRSRRVKLNSEDLGTDIGAGMLKLLQSITSDGDLSKDEVRELGAWLDSAAGSTSVPGIHCLREEVSGVLADGRISATELRVVRDAIFRVLPRDARETAERRFYEARQRETIAKELERGYDRTQPQPASEAQLAFISDLGGTPPDGLNMGDASIMIGELKLHRPSVRQQMVLRFWNRLDLMTAGVEGVSEWMDRWYAEDPDHLEAWKLWKAENAGDGIRTPDFIDMVEIGCGPSYLARVKADTTTTTLESGATISVRVTGVSKAPAPAAPVKPPQKTVPTIVGIIVIFGVITLIAMFFSAAGR
jgi:hypothetical protein